MLVTVPAVTSLSAWDCADYVRVLPINSNRRSPSTTRHELRRYLRVMSRRLCACRYLDAVSRSLRVDLATCRCCKRRGVDTRDMPGYRCTVDTVPLADPLWRCSRTQVRAPNAARHGLPGVSTYAV